MKKKPMGWTQFIVWVSLIVIIIFLLLFAIFEIFGDFFMSRSSALLGLTLLMLYYCFDYFNNVWKKEGWV